MPVPKSDLCTKTGRPVLTILKENHPGVRIAAEEGFDTYQSTPNSTGIFIFEEDVEKQAVFCSSAAGPGGVNADMLKGWLL